MEKHYLIPASMRDALIQFLATQMTMAVAEEPVAHLRLLQEFHPPKSPEQNYRDLLDCRLSGQIDDERWAQHLDDGEFRAWLAKITEVVPTTL